MEKTTSRRVLDVTLVPDKGGMATLLKKKKDSVAFWKVSEVQGKGDRHQDYKGERTVKSSAQLPPNVVIFQIEKQCH